MIAASLVLFSFLLFVLPGEAQSSEVGSRPQAPTDDNRPRNARPPRTTTSLSTREPSARDVIQMALKASRGLSPERIRELSKRARLAGLMPQLKLSVERGLKQDLSSSSTALSDRVNAAVGDDLSLGATLTLELDHLVFAPDEVRLLSLERLLATDRRKLVSEVVRLYFQRRRLLREQASAPEPDAELADSIAEVEAVLDGLTDGKFGEALEKARSSGSR